MKIEFTPGPYRIRWTYTTSDNSLMVYYEDCLFDSVEELQNRLQKDKQRLELTKNTKIKYSFKYIGKKEC